MQQEQLQQVIKALKEASNVLVTVKNSPSVDELSAAVGLTLALNKADKHATTVFSGNVPSTIEFLQPEQVIESNTDSLRDFIIALDKSKADKLRYKVEDSVVRIFITPYRTSISDKDLEFSQGDFNVDVVIALGVVTKEDFDVAITAHGRILHDATVIGITKQDAVSHVGTLNWQEPHASSVSEMISAVVDGLGQDLLDGQMATAFLTGIVSETDRFKNEWTTPDVLAVSSRLMSAGANQQLIAEKLEEPVKMQPTTKIANHESDHDDGALEIEHDPEEVRSIHIDEDGNVGTAPAAAESQQTQGMNTSPTEQQNGQQEQVARQYIETPLPRNNASTPETTIKPANEVAQPSLAPHEMPVASPQAVMNAGQQPAQGSENTQLDAMPEPAEYATMPVMQHEHKVINPLSEEFQPKHFENPISQPAPQGSLADLEQSVGSPHVATAQPQSADSLDSHFGTTRQEVPHPQEQPAIEVPPGDLPKPEPLSAPEQSQDIQADSNDPPAVPPPLMPPSQPQFFDADGKKNNNPFTAK